jgi:hypothetical protein
MVWSVCEDLGVDYAQAVVLYQSRYFEELFPEENRHFGNVVYVDAVLDDREASLARMRQAMLSRDDLSAAVFIGGMEGIFEEYTLFTRFHPQTTVLPVPAPGGAARQLAESFGRVDEAALHDLDFARLFHTQLGIAPNESRSSVYEAEPRETMAMNGGGHIAEDRRKHYELIQAVINRLATASFQIKGWTVTITTALLGVIVAAKLPSWVALLGLVPTFLFWCLDAYYLQQERLFRALYNDAIQVGTNVPVFSMDISLYRNDQRNHFWTVWRSPTVWPLHTCLMLVVIAYAIAAAWFPPRPETQSTGAAAPPQIQAPAPR